MEMKAQDMYIRLTDPTGKHGTVINHHRVWDRERFYEAQVKQHEDPKKKIEDRRLVSVATEAECNESRKVKS
jgi:hypothetical protein